MKLLINTQNKIISHGTFVFTNDLSSDIIMTDENSMKDLQDVAKCNGFEVKSKKKIDFVTELTNLLQQSDIMEITQMTDTQKYLETIQAGMESGKNDDEIKEDLYGNGVKIKDLNKIFNQIVKEFKLRLTPKERNDKAAEFLTGYEPTDVESHLAKISALQDFLECSTTQAGAAMRAWAKTEDITLPKAPKESKSTRTPGFGGNHKIIADFILANREATREQLNEFAKANVPLTKTGKENWKGYANDIWNAAHFAKIWSGEIVVEVTEEVETEEAA